MAMVPISTAAASGGEAPREIFVAPGGADSNAGTASAPLATLTAARDVARQLGPNVVRRIVVREGLYEAVALSLGPEDSGLAIVAAPGEKPVLCGGRRVVGWEREGADWVAAPMPGSRDGAVDFRCLVVNGELRPRARMPASGALTHRTHFDAPWHTTVGGRFRGADKPELKLSLQYEVGDLSPALDVRNAEVEVFHQWDSSVVGLAAHDPDTQTLTFRNPAGYPPGAFEVRRFAVWNTREGMLGPGQWYLDRSGERVVYWPKAGEKVDELTVVAPTVESLIRIAGTREAPVTDIVLEGLQFCATTTPLTAGGWAASAFLGAVEVQFAKNCVLEGLEITAVGGQAIRMADSEGMRVSGCTIVDAGAGGIYDACGVGNRIVGNRVRGIGRTYTSAIGIRSSGGGQLHPEMSRDNVVSHNTVRDAPYVGIEFGGSDSLFAHNAIYDAMQVLNDGAGFYGAGRANVLRGNLVRGIPDGKSAHAYYIDELGEQCVVEGNVAMACEWPVHMHMASSNTLRNNVFISGGDIKWSFPKCQDFTVERNVVVAAGRIRVTDAGAVCAWTNNIFYSAAGEYVGLPEVGILRVDPEFVDEARGDFAFREGSAARGLGIADVEVEWGTGAW